LILSNRLTKIGQTSPEFKVLVKILLFLPVLFLIMTSSPVKALSDIPHPIINEVMANPKDSDTGNEWLEIANFESSLLDIKDWQISFFNDPTSTTPIKTIIISSASIPVNGYLVVGSTEENAPCASCNFYAAGSFNITNSKGKVVLSDPTNAYQNVFSWSKDIGDGFSMEKIGPPKDPSYEEWQKSYEAGGTPGKKNSSADILPPPVSIGVNPTNGALVEDNSLIEFSWTNTSLQKLTYNLIISQNSNLTDPVIDENVATNKFLVEDLAWGQYYWKVVASNGILETSSLVYNFSLVQPYYSDQIIINEIMPDPKGDEIGGEWFELYNQSDEIVNLKGWLITDLKGTAHQFKISKDLNIGPLSYLIFYRKETGITFNNDQDGLKLSWPSGEVLFETPIFKNGNEGWSYIKKPNGKWDWSTKPTPKSKNIIAYPVPDDAVGGEEDKPIIINTVPIEIKTGEVENYENKLVKITAEVMAKSGNAIYLDDGTGEVKAYIQAKAKIKKPSITKGDIFEICGIVNYYRGDWRILPRFQDDLKLVKSIKEVELEEEQDLQKEASASSAKKVKEKPEPTSIKAPNIEILPKVEAAESFNNVGDFSSLVAVDELSKQKAEIKLWLQLTKSLTGLSLIFLILLIIKVVRLRRVNTIGGKFGDDYT